MCKESNKADAKNGEFWLEMTKQSTLAYCHEMLKFSVEFQRQRPKSKSYSAHIKSLDGEILKYIDKLIEVKNDDRWNDLSSIDSPFPKDLHGYIHEYDPDGGRFCPKHLMCKLAVLRDEENQINYEFLIEYDILSPDVEIYFGVKAISDSWDSSEEFTELVSNQWQGIKEGKYRKHQHKFKMTNNANHGTFWPFWCRLGTDCKENLSDAIKFLELFYKDYKNNLHLKDVAIKPRFQIVNDEIANSLLSQDDYQALLIEIDKQFGDRKIGGKYESSSSIFKKLIEKLIEEKYLEKCNDISYHYRTMKKFVEIVAIFRTFFFSLSWIPSGNEKVKREHGSKFTPIKQLSMVILDKNNRTIGRDNWDKKTGDSPHVFSEVHTKLDQWFRGVMEVKELNGLI